MSAFAHLCPQCLDVPSSQCGYRHCPVRLGAGSAAPAPVSSNADATRAVAPSAPVANANDALATRHVAAVPAPAPATAPYRPPAAAPTQGGDALQTRWVDSARAAPVASPVAPPAMPPANTDGLSTRYVSPTTEIKR